MLSGKFVRFQTRLSNASKNSTTRSAISHVGQRGRPGVRPKKAEQSSKPMPVNHKIPVSPNVSLGDAAWRRSAASTDSTAMLTTSKQNEWLLFMRVRLAASGSNAGIQFWRPQRATASTAEAMTSETAQSRVLSFANNEV